MAHNQLLPLERLVVTGLQDETIAALTTWPDHPLQQNLKKLPKMELILALKINDEDATIAMRKAELAYNLSEVLPIINHRPFPAVNPDGPCENLCMRCRKRKFEYYFKWCMHVGVCAPCKETLLAADIARQGQGDNRRAACPMCQREHLGRDISRVYLV